MGVPTAFPDLNSLLFDLVARLRTALGSNLCSVYLHGSFAAGGADRHSDVDFIVVTEGEVSETELEAFRFAAQGSPTMPRMNAIGPKTKPSTGIIPNTPQ